MFNEKLIDLIYKSKFAEWKITKWLIIYLLMPLTISYIWFISLWTIIEIPFLNYDKIEQASSILLWFFWMIFLLFIISLAIQWKTIIELEKNKLLTEVKKCLKSKKIKWYVDFDIIRSKWIYKTLIKDKNYELRIWLDENDTEWDYWRFYIWSENYDKIDENINKVFKSEKGWDYWNPYKDKIWWIENIKTQLDEIIKLIYKK